MSYSFLCLGRFTGNAKFGERVRGANISDIDGLDSKPCCFQQREKALEIVSRAQKNPNRVAGKGGFQQGLCRIFLSAGPW